MLTYARSRLLLGMFGVESIVVISGFLLVLELPLKLLPDSQSQTGDVFVPRSEPEDTADLNASKVQCR